MNYVLQAVLDELRAAKIKVLRIARDKHTKVYFEHGGRGHMFVVPTTPSDSTHAPLNAVSDLRRIIGKAHIPPKSVRAPRVKFKPRQRVLPLPADFETMPDWREKLLNWRSS